MGVIKIKRDFTWVKNDRSTYIIFTVGESFLMRRAYFSLYSLTPMAQNKTTILQIYRHYNVLILRPATLLTTTDRLK